MSRSGAGATDDIVYQGQEIFDDQFLLDLTNMNPQTDPTLNIDRYTGSDNPMSHQSNQGMSEIPGGDYANNFGFGRSNSMQNSVDNPMSRQSNQGMSELQGGEDANSVVLGRSNNMQNSVENPMSYQSCQGMSEIPGGEYANNIGLGRSNNTSTRYQQTGTGNNSFTAQTQYDSTISSSNTMPLFTPREQQDLESPAYNKGSSGVGNFANLGHDFNAPPPAFGQSVSSNKGSISSIPHLQGFSGMGFGSPTPQGVRTNMNMNTTTNMGGNMPPQNQVRQRNPVQNQPYGSNNKGFGPSTDFTTGMMTEPVFGNLESQTQSWDTADQVNQGIGSGSGSGGGQMMNRKELHRGGIQRPMAFAPGQSSNVRTDLNPFHPDYAVVSQAARAYEDVDVGDANEDEEEEESDGSTSSKFVPPRNASRYRRIIESEDDFTKLSLEREDDMQHHLKKKNQKKLYPSNEEEKMKCIGRLYEAILDTRDIVDKQSADGRKAQAARRLDENFYSAEVIEFACWELFKKCKAATCGIVLVESHHGAKREGKDEHPTFHKRWNAIVKACKDSKAVCKQILDPVYTDRLVDAPHAQYKMKLNNKKINAERDKQNKLGRMAINAGVSERDLPVGTNDPDDEGFTVTPSKRSNPRQQHSGAKRHTFKRAIKHEESDESDDEEDDEDDHHTFETPVKPRFSHSMNVSSRVMKTPHKSTPSKRSQLKATPSSSAKAKKSSPFPAPTEQLRTQYKERICDLLGVSQFYAQEYTLEDLRDYARAYNADRINDSWYIPAFTRGQYCRAHRIFTGQQNQHGYHFCHYGDFKKFNVMAVERLELYMNLHENFQHTPVTYTVGEDRQLKEILGLIPNTFGMVTSMMPPPQE